MSKDPESFQREFFLWLLQDSEQMGSPEPVFLDSDSSNGKPVGGQFSPETHFLIVDRPIDDLGIEGLEPSDLEEIGFFYPKLPRSIDFSPHSGRQPFNLGDITTVHDRFYVLLKRRLEAEIQAHPPLFPWETELSDYEPEGVDFGIRQPIQESWITHLRTLGLPVAVPERVLVQLFKQCQQLLKSALLDGARLVRAVEELFPGNSQPLNNMAGLLMAAPARSGSAVAERAQLMARLQKNLPSDYESANTNQQMLLSLLAVQEILNALTLSLSVAQPQQSSQWLTEVGPVTVNAVYQPEQSGRLGVRVGLPCTGQLQIHSETTDLSATRSGAGSLGIELFDVKPNQTCSLAISLEGVDEQPLTFEIRLLSA